MGYIANGFLGEKEDPFKVSCLEERTLEITPEGVGEGKPRVQSGRGRWWESFITWWEAFVTGGGLYQYLCLVLLLSGHNA